MTNIDFLFPKEAELKKQGKCPFCQKTIFPEKEFKDSLSLKEYTISGLCQSCQDSFFKEED